MSSAKSSESNMFENVFDFAESTARFGFLFVAEVFETAAEMSDSARSPAHGERRYSFKNLEERINYGLKRFTGTLDQLSEFLDVAEDDDKKPKSGGTAKAL